MKSPTRVPSASSRESSVSLTHKTTQPPQDQWTPQAAYFPTISQKRISRTEKGTTRTKSNTHIDPEVSQQRGQKSVDIRKYIGESIGHSAKKTQRTEKKPYMQSPQHPPHPTKLEIPSQRTTPHLPPKPPPPKAPSIQQSLSSVLPSCIRPQPVRVVFLCTNCFEYFLYPERSAHSRICHFDPSQIQYKLQQLLHLLQVIQSQSPNQYLKAIIKKLKRYIRGTGDLEDILLMEWFVRGAEVEIGLDWKEMFWVVEQLGKRREEKEGERDKGRNRCYWMFCS